MVVQLSFDTETHPTEAYGIHCHRQRAYADPSVTYRASSAGYINVSGSDLKPSSVSSSKERYYFSKAYI